MHLHFHRIVHTTTLHAYGECRCGHRKVYLGSGGHQPVNDQWLNGGPWDAGPPAPPRRPSDVGRR